ncbi:MAG: trypsin-like peptidase domain-containing protein [Sporichthyaceae bacterium]
MDERDPYFPPTSGDPWGTPPEPRRAEAPASEVTTGPDGWPQYNPAAAQAPSGSESASHYEPDAAYATPAGYGAAPAYDATPHAVTAPIPGAWGTVPPAEPGAPRRNLTAVAMLALVAALVGGAVGGSLGYNAADSPTNVSSIGAPLEGDVRPAANAPAGSVERVAAKVLPSVVSIDIRGAGGGFGGSSGSGSGVVISSDGLILTNNHVAGEGQLAVTFADGRTVRAELIKADPVTDLAVIKATGITDATPIGFGSSEELRVGQEVVAIGAPLGLAGTVTRGIVSAKNRPVIPQAGAGGADSVINGIQTDAPINPGNSGGALVDLNGNLVGITSAIASLGSGLGGQSGSIGLGFAIPVDQARVIAEQLAKGQTVAHGLLGVQVTDATEATQRGALLREITAGGAAEKAGLRNGDVVIRLDGRLIDNRDALVAGVRSLPPGEKITLTYIRGNDTRTVDVVLDSDAK